MISVIDRLMDAVDLENNLLPYMKLAGWTQSEDAGWIVLHGERDLSDHPLELVFPRERNASEREGYVRKAVELLMALKDEPLQLVVQGILNYDRDLLYARNVDTERDAIGLVLAVEQARKLKRTIGSRLVPKGMRNRIF